MVMKPILDRVLIKPEDRKQGAIIVLEDDAEVKAGTIVAVGEDVKSVKPGEKVCYFKWDDLPTPDKEFVVVREKCILGIYEDE